MKIISYPQERTSIGNFIEVELINNEVKYFIGDKELYSHTMSDLVSFKCFICRLYLIGIAEQKYFYRTFNIRDITFKRWVKKYVENTKTIFTGEKRHGHNSKLTSQVLQRIQVQIDKGVSNNQIAKKEKISESSIRYSIIKGKLIKKQFIILTATNSQSKSNIKDKGIENNAAIFEKDCKKKIYLQ